MINLVFFGVPLFAEITLEQLLRSPERGKRFRLERVITKGGSPVERLARREGLRYELIDNKQELKNRLNIIPRKGTLFLVSAYGVIFSEEVLKHPQFGCFNIHGSLLPKYRGASPIQQALLEGRKETGVTIIKMDKGIDTGEVIAQEKVAITDKDTFISLAKRLGKAGGQLFLRDALPQIPGKLTTTPQKGVASLTKPIKKGDGYVTAETLKDLPQEVKRKLQAFTPWPGVFTTVNELRKWQGKQPNKRDKRVKILEAEAAKGRLEIKKLQLEGKIPIGWREFANGYLN